MPRRLVTPSWYQAHRNTIGWLAMFAALLYIGLSARGTDQRVARQAALGAKVYHAQCILRADLVHRIGQGEQFLHDHPDGIPGFSAAAIRVSILNEQKTLRSLRILGCPH